MLLISCTGTVDGLFSYHILKHKRAGTLAPETDPEVVPALKTPYTNAKGGQKRFGGWLKVGQKRYKELVETVREGRASPKTKEVEQAALERTRKVHDLGAVEAKRNAKKPKRKSDEDDEDSDDEDSVFGGV